MVDFALAFRTAAILVERNLITETELYEFCNMQVGLATCLEIDIVKETISQTETDIVRNLLAASSVRCVQQRALDSYLTLFCHLLMVGVVDVSRRVVEI